MLRYPNLEAELARANITKLKLSDELGYTPASITLKFQGRRALVLDDMRQICKLINMPFNEETLDYLMVKEEAKE